MGAYRDNEVDAAPQLARALAALNVAGVQLTRVSLGALRLPDLIRLVADTLHSTPDDAAPLAQMRLGITTPKQPGNRLQ